VIVGADEDVVVEEEPDEPQPAIKAAVSTITIRGVLVATFDVGRLIMLASSLGLSAAGVAPRDEEEMSVVAEP
jgi:hypothetical protein